MKYWNEIVKENLSYEEASQSGYFTRKEWDGVHFRNQDDYYILLKDGKLLKNPSYIQHTDKSDWIKVTIPVSIWYLVREALDANITRCDFCLDIANEQPKLQSGEETIFRTQDGGFGIYMEQNRYEATVLSNVKFCPCCGRELR